MNNLNELKVNTRLIIASLWTVLLFVYAYIDIFSFFRADVLQNALEGKVFVFEANQVFFLSTTVYILIPSIMIFLTLVLRAKISRLCNMILPALYIVTIAGSMAGETWLYYLLGSCVEIVVLMVLIRYAWKWPTQAVSQAGE